MKFLAPKPITESVLTASTIPEPAPGEVVWAPGAYTKGQRVIRTQTHRVYQCVVDHNTGIPPEADTAGNWSDQSPTLKWAAFDSEVNTSSSAQESMTFKFRPGFFTAIGFQSVFAGSVRIVVRDAPGGNLEFDKTFEMFAPAGGLFEYLFGDRKILRNFVVDDFSHPPTAEIEITFIGTPADVVSVGLIAIGRFTQLRGTKDWSRTANGAQVEPITYSSIKTDDFGVTRIKRRHKAKNLRAQVLMPRVDLDYVISAVHEYLDVPVLVVGTDADGFTQLQAFGLMSATGTYQSNGLALLEVNVKGII